ncbi:MAG: aspartate/glutamate racemase family protein [Lautropia sp.]
MGIKIWHQSFADLARLRGYEKVLREHIRCVTRPDTEVVLHGMHSRTYVTDYPGNDIGYAYVQFLHAHQFARAAMQAEQEGYDAYALTTLPEPGLRHIRSLVSIPVVAYGESAMLTACQLGLKFGVLLFIEKMVPQIETNIREHGLESRSVGARYVGFGFDEVLANFDTPDVVVEKFMTASRALIASGADVIIPGEAPLNLLLQRAGVTRVDDVPVLDGVATTMMCAEMMVDLRQRLHIGRSTRGYYQAIPPRGRLDEIVSLYGLDRFPERPASAPGSTAPGSAAT